MTSVYFDHAGSLEIDGEKVIVRGCVFFSNLSVIEPTIINNLKNNKSLCVIDITNLEEFDTAVVILLCRIRRFVLKSNRSSIKWQFTDRLAGLLKLYGLEGSFKSH